MAKRGFSMSKDRQDVSRSNNQYDDVDDLVVNRQPKSNSSLLPIIIAMFVVYWLFNVVFKDKEIIQTLTDAIPSNKETHTKQIQSKTSKAETLHQLVSNGKVDKIKQQLSSIDSDKLNIVIDGMTPIMLAASRGNVEIIDLLFTRGADPNKRGSMKRTALQYATEKNHIEAVKRLLSYGADINAYDNGQLTPLVMAASRGHSELALLFVEKGADVNIQHIEGWTALIDATAHGDAKLVNALLEAGADKALSAENDKKAIDYAREYGFQNIEKMLAK